MVGANRMHYMHHDRVFRPLKNSFQAIHTYGLHDIHPIIPPGATLSPGSKISADKLGKIPGFKGLQGWYGFDWNSFTTLPGHLTTWATWKDAGIGVRCQQVCAVDIDVLDEEVADMVEQAVTETLGAAPVRVGRWPKRLLMYAVPAGVAITPRQLFLALPDGQRHLVEILGAHQQFVVAGQHPATGQPYGWWNWMPHHRLPVVEDFDLQLALQWVTEALAMFDIPVTERAGSSAPRNTTIDQETLAGVDLDAMAALIETLPNTYPDRETYVKIGCAIKATFADDEPRGYVLFSDWAAKWEDGEGNDPETVAADWRRMKPPFEVGAGWLMELASETPEGARKAVALQFGPGGAESPDLPPLEEGETVLAKQPATSKAPRKRKQTGTLPPELWGRYVYVESLERFVEVGCSDLLTKSQFRDRHADCGKPNSDDNAATRYIEDMVNRRCVRLVTYRPAAPLLLEENGASAVNVWVPGPYIVDQWAKAAPTDITPYQRLLDHVFPDRGQQEILLDWLAFQLQHPGVKCNWHLVLGSTAHGLGKDSLIEPVVRGIGEHNSPVISAGDLQGQWTDYLANSSLVRVEEMNNFSRREVMDRVKPMLATPPNRLRINAKGTPQYYVPNVVNVVFYTNHLDAIALEDGDRRFAVLWSEALPLPYEHYLAFYKWLGEGGDRAVCTWLAKRDLSAFYPKGTAPMTQAKKDMTDAARGPVETWILENIDREADMFRRDILSAAEIQSALNAAPGLKGAATSKKVAAVLKKHGCVYLGRHRIPSGVPGASSGQREYLWAIRNPDLYRNIAETKKAPQLYVKQRDTVMDRDMADEFAGVASITDAGQPG